MAAVPRVAVVAAAAGVAVDLEVIDRVISQSMQVAVVRNIDPRCIELMQTAVELPEERRQAWLEHVCGTDMQLLLTVQTLLEMDKETSWLDQPLTELASSLFTDDDIAACDESAATGDVIGPWRLLHELGRGGMGSVWLAERADGQFQQAVALKLIKLGMDSAHVQAQFRREREALARLQHPNIAQLIDGGIDARGRPWFAMERIEGIGLREWMEQRQPDLRQRLQLFVKLCNAVAHAHQQLVVHRDLKPSNVMVQADDEPRLLDFGIAKLVESDEAELTATAHRFLSRDFASPEQLRGEPVSTSTDVYALGLILFELLTGVRYRSVHKQHDTTLRPSALDTVAAPLLSRVPRKQLRGDLDAITLRALAEDPRRRYAGVQALADDVEQFLHGRPVNARPDSKLYRLRKTAARNRTATVAIVFALITMLATTLISVRQAERANKASRRAERSQQFLADLLNDINPFQSAAARISPGHLLDQALQRIEKEFSDVPELQITLRGTIALFISRAGMAEQHLELSARNADAAERHFGARSPELGAALSDKGIAQRKNGQEEGARISLERAEALLRDAGPTWARERISIMTGLAALANQNGDLASGRRYTEGVMVERRKLDGEESPDVAMDLMNLAANALYDERYDDAVALAQRSHDMLVKLMGPDHPRLQYVDNLLGLAQAYAGQFDAGIATLRSVLANTEAAFGTDSMAFAQRLSSLGTAQMLMDDPHSARQSYSVALPRLENAEPYRTRVLLNLGRALLAIGEDDNALALLQEAHEKMTNHSSGNLGFLQWTQAAHALALARTGKLEQAEALARRARSDLLAGSSARSSRLGEINELLASVLELRGARDEAAQLRQEAVEAFQHVLGPQHPRSLRAVALAAASD